jgi:hypothetical protein
MSDNTPISSECPSCGQERVQPGYTRDELAELLRTGAEIEAYCISCDEHWNLSTDERADIVRELTK